MSENTAKSLTEVMEALAKPFPVGLVYWKPQALTKDKTRGLAAAYADPRAYEDCLNATVPEDWSTTATFVTTGRKVVCTVHLTILGVTRAGDGDADWDDANTATSAYAQAFKRAASRFGLGRYLYGLPSVWKEMDGKVFSDAALKQLRAAYLKATGNTSKPEAKAKSKAQPEGASKAEAAPAPSLEAARATVIHFGPHKAKALIELISDQEGRDYLGWLAGGEVGLALSTYTPKDKKGIALQAAAKLILGDKDTMGEKAAKPAPKAVKPAEAKAEPKAVPSNGKGNGSSPSLEEALAESLPFGKFKGQQLSALADDEDAHDYVGWLAGEVQFGGKTFQPRYKRAQQLTAAAQVVYASLQEVTA